MNYENPELLERLAAEYVLGTLHGAARRRFEGLMLASPNVRAAVIEWENRLSGLASALPDQQPSERIWQDIERRVFPEKDRTTYFWRGRAILAGALILALVTLFVFAPQTVEREVAFVSEGNATPLWVVSMNFDTGELYTRAVSAKALDLDRVYQLWMLPQEGAPRSLGIMPVDGRTQTQRFSPALLDLLKTATGLAVSIEPPGGSPIPTPSGPVVYQAELIEI